MGAFAVKFVFFYFRKHPAITVVVVVVVDTASASEKLISCREPKKFHRILFRVVFCMIVINHIFHVALSWAGARASSVYK